MSIYEGASKSIGSYLQGETYFFIPEYQRKYSWSERNVKELISDIEIGLRSLTIAQPHHSLSYRTFFSPGKKNR